MLVRPASASLVPRRERRAGLAAPVPVVTEGLREASGIVWHPALGRFFVVGDRGTLAEVEPSGRVADSTA